MVAISLVSNVTGNKADIEQLSALLDKQTSRPLLVLDASQAVPHMYTDVQEL